MERPAPTFRLDQELGRLAAADARDGTTTEPESIFATVHGRSPAVNAAHVMLRRLFLQRFLDHPGVLALHGRWAARLASRRDDASDWPDWHRRDSEAAWQRLAQAHGTEYANRLAAAAGVWIEPFDEDWRTMFEEASDWACRLDHPWPWFAREVVQSFLDRCAVLAGGHAREPLRPSVETGSSEPMAPVHETLIYEWRDEPLASALDRIDTHALALKDLRRRLASAAGEPPAGSASTTWDDSMLEGYADFLWRLALAPEPIGSAGLPADERERVVDGLAPEEVRERLSTARAILGLGGRLACPER